MERRTTHKICLDQLCGGENVVKQLMFQTVELNISLCRMAMLLSGAAHYQSVSVCFRLHLSVSLSTHNIAQQIQCCTPGPAACYLTAIVSKFAVNSIVAIISLQPFIISFTARPRANWLTRCVALSSTRGKTVAMVLNCLMLATIEVVT